MNINYPFQIGVTSLTYPNLDLLQNVEQLPDRVNLIELTLDYPDSLPVTDKEIAQLQAHKSDQNLDYTIHLPLSARLATPNPEIRKASVKSIAQIYSRAKQLEPITYTLHLTPVYKPGGSPLTHLFEIQEYESNLQAARQSLKDLKQYVDPGDISVENLFTDMSELQDFLTQEGYSRCFDVGHLLLEGGDPLLKFYEQHSLITNVHLHGVIEGNDHQYLDPEHGQLDITGLLEVMAEINYTGPVILEQFKPQHLQTSLSVLEKAWDQVSISH